MAVKTSSPCILKLRAIEIATRIEGSGFLWDLKNLLPASSDLGKNNMHQPNFFEAIFGVIKFLSQVERIAYKTEVSRQQFFRREIVCPRRMQEIPTTKKNMPSQPTSSTPTKFNMEPENDGFQKESPFPGTSFQVPC